ncbi:MAG: cysteine-rich CWC family protein [Terriglobia bacterium]
MLKKVFALFSASKQPSNCEACGQTFQCGASLKGCWCASGPLSEEIRSSLRKKFKNCLCPHCLNNLSQNSASK